MSLKKLGVALLAVFVLGAIAANSAFAENAYKAGGTWTVAGAKLAEGEAAAKPLTTKAVGKSTLATTVAELPLKLATETIECGSCKIENKVGETQAVIGGTLAFKSIEVVEPAGCSVPGGTVTSNKLVATLGMGGSGTGATLRFAPASGTTFAIVELAGASCPIAGTYKVTGTQYGEATLPTNETKETQKVKTSAAIQASAGTATSLKFGANAATLTGELSGTLESKQVWGGTE